jgi:uncharacterized membrane protein
VKTRTVITSAALLAGAGLLTLRRSRRDGSEERLSLTRSVTVRRNPEELYDLWRSSECLPKFKHDATAAEIIDERPGRQIEWRMSSRGTTINGSVTFLPAPADRGTQVRLAVGIAGPAVKARAAVARLFGAAPQQIVMESLRAFKALAETGEIPKAVPA